MSECQKLLIQRIVFPDMDPWKSGLFCLRYGVFPCFLGVFCQECVQDVVVVKFTFISSSYVCTVPESKVHGAHVGPNWGRQDPDGPHVGRVNLAIWDGFIFILKWNPV